MKRTYKNVYGDGRVEYVEYEIDEPDDDVPAEEAIAILLGGGEV